MISGIKALTFDVGGTVLDWHRGVSKAFTDAGARRGLNADWSAITNKYRRRSLEAMVGQVKPSFNIDDVHHTVLEAVIKEHGLSTFTAEDHEAIQRTWHELDAWPDLPAALARSARVANGRPRRRDGARPVHRTPKGRSRVVDFTTLTTLGTPYDITLQELRVELFFPANEETEEVSRSLISG